MIRFVCECGRQLKAREEDAGKMTRCPSCQAILPIPTQGEEERPRRGPFQEAPAEKRRPRLDDAGDDFEDNDDRARRRRDYPEASSGKATVALVLGLGGFCVPLLAIPGLILAVLAMRDIANSRGRLGGKGLAVGGLVASCLSLFVFVSLVVLLFPAVQKVREAAARIEENRRRQVEGKNFAREGKSPAEDFKKPEEEDKDLPEERKNLRWLGQALLKFEETYHGFPQTAAFRTKDNKPGLSWRVAILPFLDQGDLFKQFKLDEPWDSPANKPLLAKMPKEF